MFLHFLTSLIKLILWLKFFHRQKQAEDMGGIDHRVLFHFTLRIDLSTRSDHCRTLPRCSEFPFICSVHPSPSFCMLCCSKLTLAAKYELPLGIGPYNLALPYRELEVPGSLTSPHDSLLLSWEEWGVLQKLSPSGLHQVDRKGRI